MPEFVPACQNIKEIHTQDVDQNVSLILNAQGVELAFATNVKILVLELVARMLFAMSLITFQCAVVPRKLRVMLLSAAILFEVILVNLLSRFRKISSENISFKIDIKIKLSDVIIRDVCSPSPCGPNSQCRDVNGQAVCSCLVGYVGSPPNCRPECVVSAECPLNQACSNQKCKDPCPGTCGIGALCQVVNHNPICSCPPSYSGNPFVRCQPFQSKFLKAVQQLPVSALSRKNRSNFFIMGNRFNFQTALTKV